MKSFKFFFPVFAACFTLVSCLSGEESESLKPTQVPIVTAQPEAGKVYPVAVIGSGAAGTMAVQRGVLNNDPVILFTGAKYERRTSRGNWVRKVENVPGLEAYKRTVLELRNETLIALAEGPLSHRLFVVDDSVINIAKEGDLFILTDSLGTTYKVQHVVLATGIMDEQPHIQGAIKPILKYSNKQTVAYCLLCDGHRSYKKNTVIIGYSEEAAQAALLIAEKYEPKKVTVLAHGNAPQIEKETLAKLASKEISVKEAPIFEVIGDPETKALLGFALESGEEVVAEQGFVFLGLRPNNQLALQLGAEVDERGLVLADSNGETTIPNLFVAGDLRANSKKQIYTAWQHAIDAMQVINFRLRQQD